MRKYILTIGVVLLTLGGLFYAVMGLGFYIDFKPGIAVTVPFRTEQNKWMRRNANGDYEALILRGVDISASMAGHDAAQFTAGEADYRRWFGYISDMGANALRVTTIMDSDFYNALYTHNTSHSNPLYLLQGIRVSAYANNNANDAYGNDFFDSLIADGKQIVDMIHGQKIVFSFNNGGDMYLRDVSDWVIGFLVGAEWTSDTIAYTDNNPLRTDSHQGEYFTTSPAATAFEAMLTQVMDHITAYESKKYKTQRPVGFISDPANDFLIYADVYAKQLNKYTQLDAEHVLPTQLMQAGSFAAYRLYDFCSDFSKYLSTDQQAVLAPLLDSLDDNGMYGGYLELLAKYHQMPVIAAGYGYSSSRGATRMDVPPLTEREQGEGLVACSQALESTGWAGGFISAWQDEWERRTWNTAFATLPGRNHLWHDLQTDGQGYGLMAFDPAGGASGGTLGRVCVPDGDDGEWEDAEPVHESKGIRVYAAYDEQGLFLLVRKTGLTPDDILYLPLDISPKTGSYAAEHPTLSFTRPVDFLLVLHGKNETRLLVQERYDTARQRFLQEMTGGDPYVNVPAKDSPIFTTVYMTVANTLIFDEITLETRLLQRHKSWETGRLIHGNANPASAEYHSLADFCYGTDLVEIRLPWSLLNFYDPSSMQVHDDYYERYGVEGLSVRRVYIGAEQAGTDGPISLSPITLTGWNRKVSSAERLKQSYYIIKDCWGCREYSY